MGTTARSLETPAKFAMATLAIIAAMHLIMAIALVNQIGLLARASAGTPYLPGEAESNDALINGLASGGQVAFYAAGAAFLVWFHRAYNNLTSFGVPLPFYKWGAVLSFVIPFVNLVRPYQVMAVVMMGSSSPPRGWNPFVGLWWAAYLSMAFLGVASRWLFAAAKNDIGELRNASVVGTVHALVAAAAAVLAILLVREVTRRQSRRTPEEVAATFD